MISNRKKLKANNIIHLLNGLAFQLNEIKNINDGGCCVVASILAQELEGVLPFEIWVSNYDVETSDDIRKKAGKSCAISWQDLNWSFYHVLLRVKIGRTYYLFDSNGLVKESECNEYQGRYLAGRIQERTCRAYLNSTITIEECMKFAAQEKAWNKAFNRNQIPKIQETVAKFFMNNGISY